MRMFPVLKGRLNGLPSVPWAFVAPHEEQARQNHGGQSLERLAQRGGLSPMELVAAVCDLPLEWLDWSRVKEMGAVRWLEQRLHDLEEKEEP